jgi:uncharacterized protein (DUF305 family)
VAALLLAAVLVATALYAGTRLVDDSVPTAPSDSSVDAGFARDMRRHHTQAVEMSLSVLGNSRDGQVRTLATDILLTQQQQIGQMYAWLQSWGLSQGSSAEPMRWMQPSADGETSHEMGHMGGGHDAGKPGITGMPGMASPEKLDSLDRAGPRRVDVAYLRLMIPHHRGALGMARYAADEAENADVRRLAGAIAAGQVRELEVLKQMLRERS